MNLTIASLTRFPKIFTETLNKHASIKKEYVQANQANFATRLTESNYAKILKRKIFTV